MRLTRSGEALWENSWAQPLPSRRAAAQGSWVKGKQRKGSPLQILVANDGMMKGL
jgi:hypothetical protein